MTRDFREFAVNCSEATNREACDERLKAYKKIFKNLIKYRVYKAMKFESLPEDTFDKPFLQLILNMIDAFVSALDEVVADDKGNVYVIVKKQIEVEGVLVRPGEMVMMNLMEAIALSSFGYVELLRLPVETSEKYEWMRTERVTYV